MKKRKKKKDSNEITAVGAVAPSGHDRLTISSSQPHKRNRSMAKKKLKIKEKRNLEQAIRKEIRSSIFNELINEVSTNKEKAKNIIQIHDSINNQMNDSFANAKKFLMDAMKNDNASFVFNLRRVKTELNLIRRLMDDMEEVANRLYKSNKENL